MKKNISTLNTNILLLLQDIKDSGGTGFLVGGYVRDKFLNIENNDIDIEIYGLDYKKINSILNRYGKVDEVGKAFGVFKVNIDGMDYDFSLPRRESKVSSGHKGFSIFGDPFMTTLEASTRRDFTINSIMIDPIDNFKVIDHHNGINDIKERRLRYVSESFSEDPLRVLRGMQFASRFNVVACEDTINLCKGIKDTYNEISKERVWGEWQKWSLSEHPELGIEFIDKTCWIEHYPEIDNLKGCQQSPDWHPEGDVFIHTNLCLKESSRVATERNYSEKDRMILVFAILCHDFGKPETTQVIDGKIRAFGHAEAGVKHAKSFLSSINAPKWLIESVLPLVDRHIHHAGIHKPNKRNVRRLINTLSPASIELWDAVVEADKSGRYPLPKGKLDGLWLEVAGSLKEEVDSQNGTIKPVLLGRHLIEAGLKPSPLFGKILDDAYEYQLEHGFKGVSDSVDWLKGSDYYIEERNDSLKLR